MIKRIRSRLEMPVRWLADRYVEKHPERYKAQFRQQLMADIAQQMLLTPVTEHEEGDIFLASYPRSGNTWVRNLIVAGIHQVDLQFVSHKLMAILMPAYDVNYYMRIFNPTFFKTHLLPQPEFKRVIYIVRDGRDVMTSYYHFRRARGHTETLLELVAKDDLYPSTWQQHVEQWLANPYNADMLVIRYEDLIQNPVQQLEKIAEFADTPRPIDLLERAVEQANFESMQQREIKYGSVRQLQPVDDVRDVRRGEVGSHKDEMPPDVLAAFLERAGSTLRALDYVKG